MTQVIFLARHGGEHSVPPHKINHKANVQCLKSAGCNKIISISAVGSADEKIIAGSLFLPDQFIDFSREVTSFFDGENEGVEHVDLTEPFDAGLRKTTYAAAKNAGVPVNQGGVYFCMSGPGFETRAEIEMIRRLGGNVVGMTVAPEAKLAREAGIAYQPINLVVNMAAGMQQDAITHEHTLQAVKEMLPGLVTVLKETLATL